MDSIAATLRKALTSDVLTIAEIFLSARRQAMPFLPVLHTDDEITAWIARSVLNEREVWLAEVDDRCVGFIAIGFENVDHLYIHPAHQGHGIGTSLLEIAKKRFARLQLFVFQENGGARRFYEREGFRLLSLYDGSGNEEKEPDALYEWRQGI